jgi:hypothetical protein
MKRNNPTFYLCSVALIAALTVFFARAGTAHAVLQIWNEFFAVNESQTPETGDFNGDNMADIITFLRQDGGDVYVGLSNGASFNPAEKWHDFFAVSEDEVVLIGDFNGDGLDDIATWLRNSSKQVYVALSSGSNFGDATVWINDIGTGEEEFPNQLFTAIVTMNDLQTGDVNGDGRGDLVLFDRGSGQVYVALSNGTGFAEPTLWHRYFAINAEERPYVGDFDGDGMDDIVTFLADSNRGRGNVFVAISNGAQFGDGATSELWSENFAVSSDEVQRVGDLNGDGRTDVTTFLPPEFGDVYVAFSQGSFFSDASLRETSVIRSDADHPFLADANGDGKDDIIVFSQDRGFVQVSISP